LEHTLAPSTSYRLLQIALVCFGAVMVLLYPLAVVWPSGWAWHQGAPYQSDYFMMIVVLYATLGVFVCNAARRPEANVSLIWFTVWSSLVHGSLMVAQSFTDDHRGHLWGDVPALLLAAVVLATLLRASGIARPDSRSPREVA
jgi:FtsH-binding integral membrane protein